MSVTIIAALIFVVVWAAAYQDRERDVVDE
jgi:hypothetical protein